KPAAAPNTSPEWVVQFTVNRRPENSTSAGEASSIHAAIRLPFSTIWSAAFAMTIGARPHPRSEWAPPPARGGVGVAGDRAHRGHTHAEPLHQKLREARGVALAGREGAQ